MNPRWFLALPLLAGLVFLGVGLALFTDEEPERELRRVLALPRVTGGALEPVGQTVLVQGTIAASSPKVDRDFVACVRSLFDGYDDEPISEAQSRSASTAPVRHQVERWKRRDVLAPALTLDLSDGPVQLSAGYELRNPTRHAKDSVSGFTVGKTPEALDGFSAGDLVTVEGQLGSGRTLTAAVVEGGDVAAYLDARRVSVKAAHVLGLVFMPLGTVLVLGSAFILRRTSRARRST